jgi:CMP-N,N'-diacetyllegionaminic acid synthase
MREELRVLALIPARGGSKGVPRKNVRTLVGKPLIAWTIEAARNCPSLDRVVVSTDDEEIAGVAREYGAEVPFLRPAALAQDDTPDLPVCKHCLVWLTECEGYRPDVVLWLRPTVPLRLPEDMEGAVALLVQSGADGVRSICRAEHHPYWMKRLEAGRLVPLVDGCDERTYYRRQLLPSAYRLNGAADVVRRDLVLQSETTMYGDDVRGFVMPVERSVDLDGEMDFALAEWLLRGRTL